MLPPADESANRAHQIAKLAHQIPLVGPVCLGQRSVELVEVHSGRRSTGLWPSWRRACQGFWLCRCCCWWHRWRLLGSRRGRSRCPGRRRCRGCRRWRQARPFQGEPVSQVVFVAHSGSPLCCQHGPQVVVVEQLCVGHPPPAQPLNGQRLGDADVAGTKLESMVLHHRRVQVVPAVCCHQRVVLQRQAGAGPGTGAEAGAVSGTGELYGPARN